MSDRRAGLDKEDPETIKGIRNSYFFGKEFLSGENEKQTKNKKRVLLIPFNVRMIPGGTLGGSAMTHRRHNPRVFFLIVVRTMVSFRLAAILTVLTVTSAEKFNEIKVRLGLWREAVDCRLRRVQVSLTLFNRVHTRPALCLSLVHLITTAYYA